MVVAMTRPLRYGIVALLLWYRVGAQSNVEQEALSVDDTMKRGVNKSIDDFNLFTRSSKSSSMGKGKGKGNGKGGSLYGKGKGKGKGFYGYNDDYFYTFPTQSPGSPTHSPTHQPKMKKKKSKDRKGMSKSSKKTTSVGKLPKPTPTPTFSAPQSASPVTSAPSTSVPTTTIPTTSAPTRADVPIRTSRPTPRPTRMPVQSEPTEAPTSAGVSLALTPYSLFYTIEQTRIPLRSEIEGLAALTDDYLSEFFMIRLDTLQDLETVRIDSDFRLLQPFIVNYTSTASFPPNAAFVPDAGELDLLVSLAFSGANLQTYLALLATLSDDNIFATTSVVSIETPPDENDPVMSTRNVASRSMAVGTSAVAAAFVAVLLGIVLYRRDLGEDDGESKGYDRGNMTVDGDTYAATSTMYTGSDTQSEMLHGTRYSEDTNSLTNRSDLGMGIHLLSEEASLAEGSAATTLPLSKENLDILDEQFSMDRSDDPLASDHLESERIPLPIQEVNVTTREESSASRVSELIRKFSPL